MLAVDRDVKPRNMNFAKVGGGGVYCNKYGIFPGCGVWAYLMLFFSDLRFVCIF